LSEELASFVDSFISVFLIKTCNESSKQLRGRKFQARKGIKKDLFVSVLGQDSCRVMLLQSYTEKSRY